MKRSPCTTLLLRWIPQRIRRRSWSCKRLSSDATHNIFMARSIRAGFENAMEDLEKPRRSAKSSKNLTLRTGQQITDEQIEGLCHLLSSPSSLNFKERKNGYARCFYPAAKHPLPKSRKSEMMRRLSRNKLLYVMILPGMLYFLIFKYFRCSGLSFRFRITSHSRI